MRSSSTRALTTVAIALLVIALCQVGNDRADLRHRLAASESRAGSLEAAVAQQGVTVARLEQERAQTAERASAAHRRAEAYRARAGKAERAVQAARASRSRRTEVRRLSPPVTRGSAPARTYKASSRTTGVDWDGLAQCESGGRWNLATGNGYWGGLQFNLGTWRAFGGAGMPHKQSRSAQIAVAERVLAAQGRGAWPGCTAKGAW